MDEKKQAKTKINKSNIVCEYRSGCWVISVLTFSVWSKASKEENNRKKETRFSQEQRARRKSRVDAVFPYAIHNRMESTIATISILLCLLDEPYVNYTSNWIVTIPLFDFCLFRSVALSLSRCRLLSTNWKKDTPTHTHTYNENTFAW